jgi:hypothetical protein
MSMERIRTRARPIVHLLLVSFLGMNMILPTARADIVGTAEVLGAQPGTEQHGRLQALLERADVAERLQALGVSPADVRERVARLSDEEVAAIDGKLERLPAGGSDVLGFILVIFLVLLFTDLMGWTDVFPFVKRTAR